MATITLCKNWTKYSIVVERKMLFDAYTVNKLILVQQDALLEWIKQVIFNILFHCIMRFMRMIVCKMIVNFVIRTYETWGSLWKTVENYYSMRTFYFMDISCSFNCRASECNDCEINHQSRWPLIGLFVCRHCK